MTDPDPRELAEWLCRKLEPEPWTVHKPRFHFRYSADGGTQIVWTNVPPSESDVWKPRVLLDGNFAVDVIEAIAERGYYLTACGWPNGHEARFSKLSLTPRWGFEREESFPLAVCVAARRALEESDGAMKEMNDGTRDS